MSRVNDELNKLAVANNPHDEIAQIKGKQNAAPVEDYLPYVQDFVKSGQWGRVGDLRNTGLRQMKDVFGGEEMRRLSEAGAFDAKDLKQMDRYISSEEAIELARKIDPDDKAAETAIVKAFLSQRGGYARGGSVAKQDSNPQGFLPNDLAGWADYLERMQNVAA